jgi:hypothetical protein
MIIIIKYKKQEGLPDARAGQVFRQFLTALNGIHYFGPKIWHYTEVITVKP